MTKLPIAAILLVVTLLLSCCSSNSPEDLKKNVRMDWQNYFNAYLDYHGKDSKMGTDSTKIVFENNSDYTIDSAVLIFENQGLLVHSYDTVRTNFILSKSKKAFAAPVHKLGWTHNVSIFAIYSKALEFHYRANLPEAKKTGDCYYCK